MTVRPASKCSQGKSASVARLPADANWLSQLEDMLFRIRVSVLDPVTKVPVSDALCAVSDPIKVVSKPEQIKKKASETLCWRFP